MARPVAFKEEYVDQARRLATLGLIDVEMAKFWDVTKQTVINWKKRYPEFADALREGKAGPDAEVVMSLYRRATGYSHPSEKIAFDRDGNELRAKYTEHYPPDTTAMIFWLKNRRPDLWRDKIDVNNSGGPAVVNHNTNVLVQDNRKTVNITVKQAADEYAKLLAG